VLSEAFAEADRTGGRQYQAELHRLKGELLLTQDATVTETSFRQAIKVARNQGARSWELRAVTSLSRLHHLQGNTERARNVLAETVNWFAESFDTPDLQEAEALLKTLA
jgi:hypothetical protein